MNSLKEWIEKQIEDIKREAIEYIQRKVEGAKHEIDELKKYVEEISKIELSDDVENVLKNGGIVATTEIHAPYSSNDLRVYLNTDILFRGGFAFRKLMELPNGKYKLTIILERIDEEVNE